MKSSPPPGRKAAVSGTVSEKKGYHGLCSCCSNALTCTYPRDPDKSVVECDEFEGSLTSPLKTAGLPFSVEDLPPASPRTSHFKGKRLDERKGLCSICEARATCTYPKPQGGVWHCEEYR